MVKVVGVLIQQSLLNAVITFFRKCFYSGGGDFFFPEICFSNSSYTSLQSALINGLQIC